MKPITPTQQAIINCIVAEHEETGTSNPLAAYMRAIEGRFEPDMNFTLYNLETAGLVLYVQDQGDNPGQFKARCAGIKKQLVVIADFIRSLALDGAVRTLLRDKIESPPNIPEQWRAYTDFSPEERKPLSFAVLVQVIPRLELYDYWEALQAGTDPYFSIPLKESAIPVLEQEIVV